MSSNLLDSFKKYLAEFIGTFVLVFFACGAAATLGPSVVNPGAYLITALAFGLVIVAMAYSIGNISGCHINPAVSLAMLLTKQMSAKDFCGYVIAQVLGAFAGAGLLIPFVGEKSSLGANDVIKTNGDGKAIVLSLVLEVILTCVFVLVILFVTSKKENGRVSGLVIGLTLTLVHILGIAYTGTSVNPARSLAPALLCGHDGPLSHVWIFIVAPLVGAAIAAGLYLFFTKKNAPADTND